MNLTILKFGVILSSLGLCALTLLNFVENDTKVEQQKQESSLKEQSINHAPLKPEVINELVLTHPESATPDELIKHLPTSLLNTPMPERLDINQDGSLFINKKILHLFEFYLSAIGEESLALIVARIKYSLQEQLTAQALSEALQILAGYLQYRNEITALKQEYNQAFSIDEYSFEQVINTRNELIATRWRFLSRDVIAAFFEQEDEYENYMLNLTRISRDNNLSADQKNNAIAILNAQTPSWLIEQQNAANQLNKYRQQYSEMVSKGASDSELRILTEQTFNAEVSDRLSTLDTQRSQWQQRLSEYRAELITIVAIESDRQAQQTLIEALRNQHFNTQEIRRVSALDSRYLEKYH